MEPLPCPARHRRPTPLGSREASRWGTKIERNQWLTGAERDVMISFLSVSKVEQKEIKLEIGLSPTGFPKTMYFNRFRIEREEGLCLVQFGFVSASGLLDSYSCVLPKEALTQNQKVLLDYLNRIGRPAENSPLAWKGAPVEKQTEVADIITWLSVATWLKRVFTSSR